MTDSTEFPDRFPPTRRAALRRGAARQGHRHQVRREEKTNVEDIASARLDPRRRRQDRRPQGNPLTIKLKGKVEPYFQKKE